MTDTANLGLPVIEAAQAQKHVTHNEALRILDTLVQLSVLDRDLGDPPGAPAEGQRWIVAASPTGAWAGHVNDIAAWQDGAWQFSTPQLGWMAFVADEGTLVVWNGAAWGDFFATVTSIQNLALFGIGTTADATNPFSAKLNKALWTAKTAAEGGDGDLRYTLNKEGTSNVLSLLMQSAFSGRAELGLIGDDSFALKVSADGSAWSSALVADAATGAVSFPSTPGGWGEPVASWSHSSDVASVSFTGLGGYRALLLLLVDLTHNSGSTQNWFVRLSTDNGSTYKSTSGDYARYGINVVTNGLMWASGAAAAVVGGIVEILDFNIAARRSFIRVASGQLNAATGAFSQPATMTAAEAYNAVQVLPTGGSITAGSIFVFGKR